MKVIINTRTGIIHTTSCENTQQLQKINLLEMEVDSRAEINDAEVCGHCLRNEQRIRIEKQRLEEESQ